MDNNSSNAHPWNVIGVEIQQGDIAAAFLHTTLEEEENVFVEML